MIKNSNMRTLTILAAAFLMTVFLGACGKSQTTASLLVDARQYQSRGEYKTAIIQLKNALQKSPDNVDARFLLGTIYNQTGDAKSAEKELRKALDLGMDAARVWPELGHSLLAQGQFGQILDETTQMAGEQGSAALLTLRGNAYLSSGKKEEAKASFEQALKNKPGDPTALLGLSRHALTEKNIEAATGYADQAVTGNPKDINVWLFKGDLLRVQGKAEPALAAYDQALKLQPDNISAHINKAFLEITAAQYDAAKLDIDAARKANPNNLLVFYTQALLDFTQGKSSNALESLQQVLRAAPDHMPSVLLAGAVQYSLGSMPQAEQNLRKYLGQDPGNLYAQKLLASTLMKSGQPQAVITVLSQAMKDNQQDVQLLALLGEAYMQTGDYTQATTYFSRASVLAPKAAELHTALGLSKLAQGENDLATSEMETAVKLDTQSPKSGIMLVMTELRLKEYDKALVAAKAVEKSQPDNPLAHNLKGAAYLGKNDLVSARASFEKALSLQPANFPAVVNLAQLDLQDKKPDLAKKRFEALLEKDKKNAQVMTALAKLAVSQGQIKEATGWLEKASQENPDALGPSLQLIAHYLSIGEKKQALALAKKLEGSNSGNPDFLDSLAQAQFANDDKPSALDTYNKLAALKPDSAPVQFRIASIHMAMKNLSEAANSLRKALVLQPNYLEAQLALASVEAGKGDYPLALSMARQIQKQDHKSPVGFELEGNLQMQQKNPDLAVKAFEQAFNISPNGQLMVKLHAVLSQTGKGRAADQRLAAWLKANPGDAAARMYQAGIYLGEKQNKAAIEQYQTILKQAPNYVPALNNLAWLYQQEKDSRALEYAEKANQLAPDNPATQDTLGWILVEQGNTTRGLTVLQKASGLAPADAEIRYHLVQGWVKSGDKARARKELEQLLATGGNFSKAEEARELLKKL
ncbi:MAG: PEP-CTERM system TPR-repeat protein PrsT [Proteobacteria bacterium]|nr:PEP-CTERM system TPR-repeat protein PrsT [Pseudomonadota bacterium]